MFLKFLWRNEADHITITHLLKPATDRKLFLESVCTNVPDLTLYTVSSLFFFYLFPVIKSNRSLSVWCCSLLSWCSYSVWPHSVSTESESSCSILWAISDVIWWNELLIWCGVFDPQVRAPHQQRPQREHKVPRETVCPQETKTPQTAKPLR